MNHEVSMRYNTWGNIEEKMRTRLDCSIYCMRYWLRLLQHSQSLLSYPLPMSMLFPGGINHNNIPVLEFMSSWISDQNLQFFYHMCSHYLFARAYNDLIPVVDGYEVGFVQWASLEHMDLVSISCYVCICFFSKKAVATSFQNAGFCFSLDLRDW